MKKINIVLLAILLFTAAGLSIFGSVQASQEDRFYDFSDELTKQNVQFMAMVLDGKVILLDDTDPAEVCRLANTQFPDAGVKVVGDRKHELTCSEVE